MDGDKMKIVFVTNTVGPELEPAVRAVYGDMVSFMTPDEALAGAAEWDAVMCADRALSSEFLSKAKKLRWVHAQSHGYFQLLSPTMMAHQATVTNARGAHAESVSEHVFAMLLGLARHLRAYWDLQAQHRWQRITMDTLYGKTMCVIGVGSIGSQVARKARGFGMRVVGIDLLPIVCDSVDQLFGAKELDTVLPYSDVVVIAVPYSDSSKDMFDARRLGLMKSGAYLINIARGGIVDEKALTQMLQSARLSGAGFDVFESEPLPPESPLWDAPNTILLPHSASQTALSRKKLVDLVIEQIRRFRAGEPLINVVKNGAAG